MMSLTLILAAVTMSQAVPMAVPMETEQSVDVAFEEMVAAKNDAAIQRIEANGTLEKDDPARLLNLGLAHAREGRDAEARAMFRAAAQSEDRVRLETASGEWVDSRRLAYRALALLDGGQLTSSTLVASR